MRDCTLLPVRERVGDDDGDDEEAQFGAMCPCSRFTASISLGVNVSVRGDDESGAVRVQRCTGLHPHPPRHTLHTPAGSHTHTHTHARRSPPVITPHTATTATSSGDTARSRLRTKEGFQRFHGNIVALLSEIRIMGNEVFFFFLSS